MGAKIVRFGALLFTALTLGASLAHFLSLPAQVNLGEHDSLTLQQLYRGWQFFGLSVLLALVFTLAQAILVRENSRALDWTLLALGCLCASQLLFWAFNYPPHATDNWTFLPLEWTTLRLKWQYAHAASAGLNLIAHMSLVTSLLSTQPRKNQFKAKRKSVFWYPALPAAHR